MNIPVTWMSSGSPKRIAVKGESAGATYAALLAIAARDRKEFSLCLQTLLYPTLDDRTGSTRHLPEQFGKYVWNPQANQYAWTSLLGVTAGSRHVPENAVPARAKDLSGLAPLFIGVGSIDLSAPENIEYAQPYDDGRQCGRTSRRARCIPRL